MTESPIKKFTTMWLLANIIIECFWFTGHILCQPLDHLWTPAQGKLKQGKPSATHSLMIYVPNVGLSWDEAEAATANQARWISFGVQCTSWHRSAKYNITLQNPQNKLIFLYFQL